MNVGVEQSLLKLVLDGPKLAVWKIYPLPTSKLNEPLADSANSAGRLRPSRLAANTSSGARNGFNVIKPTLREAWIAADEMAKKYAKTDGV